MALKILHTADWHLGMRFGAFGEEDERTLTRARLQVVERLLGAAERYEVDAILCAGDLFDDPDPSPEWWEGLARLFSSRDWSQRPVFLLPGNHDPLTPTSVYAADHAFRRALPAGVHVVDRDDYSFELSPDAVLYSTPCRSHSEDRDLALGLPAREPGDERIRIGLIHGQTFDIDGSETNFPLAKDAAIQRGLDYLAIGDTHSFRLVPPDAAVPTVYPSAPEQTKFGESDAGCVAIVFFNRRSRRARVHRERVGRWSWATETVTSMDALRELGRRNDLRESVVRLTLDLRVPLGEYDEARQILRELRGTQATYGRIGVLDVDDSGLVPDMTRVEEVLEELPDALQGVVARLQAREAEDPETAQRALYHLYRTVRQR